MNRLIVDILFQGFILGLCTSLIIEKFMTSKGLKIKSFKIVHVEKSDETPKARLPWYTRMTQALVFIAAFGIIIGWFQ